MDRHNVAQVVAEVTRQVSFGTSGLVARGQLNRFEDSLATKIADRLAPPEPVLTPYQEAKYRELCTRNEELIAKLRQAEVEEFYEKLQNGNMTSALLEQRKTINERWLAELERANTDSKKTCFLMPRNPKKQVRKVRWYTYMLCGLFLLPLLPVRMLAAVLDL